MKTPCLILLLCAGSLCVILLLEGCTTNPNNTVTIKQSTWTPVKVQPEPEPKYSHDPLIRIPPKP